jgi:hypothetical protein
VGAVRRALSDLDVVHPLPAPCSVRCVQVGAVATKSDDQVLKPVAIAAADEQAAQTLLHDLATLRQKREGTPQHNSALAAPRQPRWIRPA